MWELGCIKLIPGTTTPGSVANSRNSVLDTGKMDVEILPPGYAKRFARPLLTKTTIQVRALGHRDTQSAS